MIVGIIVYYLIKAIAEGKLHRHYVILGFGAVSTVISVGFVILHLNKRYMTSSVIAGLLFCFLFLLCSQIDNAFVEKKEFKPFVLIGKYSYGIYCFHQIVINCAMRFGFNKECLLQWGAVYFVIAVLSCLIGYVVEKVEKRLIA